MNRESIIEKLLKVKALADQGERGERNAAAIMLQKLMDKYNITFADLEDEEEKSYYIPFRYPYEKRIIVQAVYMNIGPSHCYKVVNSYTKRTHKKIHVRCSPADFVRIQLDIDFYLQKFEDDLNLFISAFFEKNKMFPPPELDDREQVEDEKLSKEDLMKLSWMMNGIDYSTRKEALPDHTT